MQVAIEKLREVHADLSKQIEEMPSPGTFDELIAFTKLVQDQCIVEEMIVWLTSSNPSNSL